MKKLIGLIMFSLFSLGAMEKPSSSVRQDLIIDNTTKWPALILYKVNGEILTRTVYGKSVLTIADAKSVKSLKVVPHGDVWGKANIENLTAGYVTLPDEADKIQEYLRSRPGSDVRLVISLPEGFTGNFSAFIIKVPGSKSFEIGKEPERHLLVPKSRLLEDVFPAVRPLLYPSAAAALFGEKPIEARHFLNLPANPSPASVEAAYVPMRKDWESMVEGGGAGDKAMAEDVLKILDVAHQSLVLEQKLKEKNAELQNLIKDTLKTFHRY